MLALPVCSQDRNDEDEPIILAHPPRATYLTVVASGDEARIDSFGQAVSIIGETEIRKVQGGDIVRVLERMPGVTLARNGGPGSFTGLRVRGAEAEQLLVLVDGVAVADSASPGNGFDFGNLLPGGIGKLELLRSSNSTIWGSQAIGGVLAVESGGLHGATASLEYGGQGMLAAQASAARSFGELVYSADVALLDSDGFSSAAGGSEADGFRQLQLGGKTQFHIADPVRLRLGLNFLDARLEIDGFPPPDYLLGDTDEFQDTSRISGFAGFDIFVDDLRINGTWSLSETRRENYDPSIGADPVYATAGREQRAGLRGFWRLTGEFHAHFGGERVWNEFSTLFDAQRRGSSAGAYAQVGLSTGAFALNAGARIDDHEGFGSEWSLGADAVLALGYGWRLRAALGEGFKAPSLFQRYSEYGNEALQPERSRSFDIGLERGDRNDDWHFAFSAFRRESEELIGFVSCFAGSTGICADRPFGTFDNVGLARAQGIELEAAFRPSDWLRLQGAWSYVEASDRTRESANQGNDLARRPRHALTLSADWDSQLAGLNLGADLRIVSSSFDDAANLVPLAGYRVGTIRASIPLTGEVELFGRVENIWDERYQTAAGYGTPGRSAYIGARAQW